MAGQKNLTEACHLFILSKKGTKESIPDVKNEEAEVSIARIEQSVSTLITVSTTTSTMSAVFVFLASSIKVFFHFNHVSNRLLVLKQDPVCGATYLEKPGGLLTCQKRGPPSLLSPDQF